MLGKSQQISSEATRLGPTTMFATSEVSEILFLCSSDVGTASCILMHCEFLLRDWLVSFWY